MVRSFSQRSSGQWRRMKTIVWHKIPKISLPSQIYPRASSTMFQLVLTLILMNRERLKLPFLSSFMEVALPAQVHMARLATGATCDLLCVHLCQPGQWRGNYKNVPPNSGKVQGIRVYRDVWLGDLKAPYGLWSKLYVNLHISLMAIQRNFKAFPGFPSEYIDTWYRSWTDIGQSSLSQW